MARIRSAKPDWWQKEKWCALPRDVRFTYKGIWEVMADDEGRFQADTRLVKAQVWPLDDDITPKKLEQWLAQLERVMVTRTDGTKVPAVQLYTVDGVRYGYLAGFEKHQKISHRTPSKLPSPPEPFRSHSGNDPESFSPDTDKDFDKDGDTDADGSGAASGPVTMEAIVKLVAIANRGLAEHTDPARRQAVPRLIASAAHARDATESIVSAGVPLDFAERAIYEVATTCEPDGEVTSLRYFATAVIRKWKAHSASVAAGGVTPPRRRSRFAPPSQQLHDTIAAMTGGGTPQ